MVPRKGQDHSNLHGELDRLLSHTLSCNDHGVEQCYCWILDRQHLKSYASIMPTSLQRIYFFLRSVNSATYSDRPGEEGPRDKFLSEFVSRVQSD